MIVMIVMIVNNLCENAPNKQSVYDHKIGKQ